jgi:hypothetical protein
MHVTPNVYREKLINNTTHMRIWGQNIMKRNIERKYIWNFLRASVVIGVALALLMPGSAAVANYGKTAKVQASVNTIVASTTRDIIYVDAVIFTIENPPVDFEVVDAEPFDGFGDNGPYSTFNDALLGDPWGVAGRWLSLTSHHSASRLGSTSAPPHSK